MAPTGNAVTASSAPVVSASDAPATPSSVPDQPISRQLETQSVKTQSVETQYNEIAQRSLDLNSKTPESRRAAYDAAMDKVASLQTAFQSDGDSVVLSGDFVQGGLVFGETIPGAVVTLDGDPVMVSDDGRFVIGFGRDSALSALLVTTLPSGTVDRRSLEIGDREFRVERIDGLNQSKVSGFSEAQLEKIGIDREKKDRARATTVNRTDYAAGFEWPLRGRISGVFGSQRVLNGEPKRPHSGLDIAAPTGTPIKAPAAGVIRLAETGMYFEGGLVFLDHGQWLESAFLHMSRVDVTPGQRVEQGEVIGAVGMTGRATGPHLHWSVKWKGRLVDPQLLLEDG